MALLMSSTTVCPIEELAAFSAAKGRALLAMYGTKVASKVFWSDEGPLAPRADSIFRTCLGHAVDSRCHATCGAGGIAEDRGRGGSRSCTVRCGISG